MNSDKKKSNRVKSNRKKVTTLARKKKVYVYVFLKSNRKKVAILARKKVTGIKYMFMYFYDCFTHTQAHFPF